ENLGHDRRTGLCEGDWAEIGGDRFEFAAIAPSLGQVTKIERSRRLVTLSVDPADTTDFSSATLLRRWDQSAGVNASGTIDVVEGVGNDGWISLERGIQIQFTPGALYRAQDHWTIPARVAIGDLIWKQDANGPIAIPPDGVERHRGPI